MIRTLTLFAGMALLAGAIIYAAHPSTAAKRWQAEYNVEQAQCLQAWEERNFRLNGSRRDACALQRWAHY